MEFSINFFFGSENRDALKLWTEPLGDKLVLKLRGLHYGCNKEEVITFFRDELGRNIISNGTDGVLIFRRTDGRCNGIGFILIKKKMYSAAMKKNRGHLAGRYIEVYPSSLREALEIMERSQPEELPVTGAKKSGLNNKSNSDAQRSPNKNEKSASENKEDLKAVNKADDPNGRKEKKRHSQKTAGDQNKEDLKAVKKADDPNGRKEKKRHSQKTAGDQGPATEVTASSTSVANDPPEEHRPHPPAAEQRSAEQHRPAYGEANLQDDGVNWYYNDPSYWSYRPYRNVIRFTGVAYEADCEDIINFLGDLAPLLSLYGISTAPGPYGRSSDTWYVELQTEYFALHVARMRDRTPMVTARRVRIVHMLLCTVQEMPYGLQICGPSLARMSLINAGFTGRVSRMLPEHPWVLSSLMDPGAVGHYNAIAVSRYFQNAWMSPQIQMNYYPPDHAAMNSTQPFPVAVSAIQTEVLVTQPPATVSQPLYVAAPPLSTHSPSQTILTHTPAGSAFAIAPPYPSVPTGLDFYPMNDMNNGNFYCLTTYGQPNFVPVENSVTVGVENEAEEEQGFVNVVTLTEAESSTESPDTSNRGSVTSDIHLNSTVQVAVYSVTLNQDEGQQQAQREVISPAIEGHIFPQMGTPGNYVLREFVAPNFPDGEVTMYMGNLPPYTTAEDVRNFFSSRIDIPVENIRVTEPANVFSSKEGFVTFPNRMVALMTMMQIRDRSIGGHMIYLQLL